MAVTITQAELRDAIRVGDTAEEIAQATRLLAVASEMVVMHAPAAPSVIQDEAVIRISGYLFDKPQAPGGIAYANAGRNSGAWSLLLPYRFHRAGSTAAASDG